MARPLLLLSLMLDQGGSERQLTEMALAMDRRRYVPHVATFRAYGMRADELHAAGVPVLDLAVRSFRSAGALRGAWRLARYIRRHRIEVVHSFDAPLTVFGTPVTRWLTPAVMISSQRGHRNLTPEYRRLLRWTDPQVAAIVVNCQYLKRHLIAEESVAADRIEVCYNGIDLQRLEHPSSPPPALAGARYVIGTVCALRPEKGLSHLLEAYAQVRRSFPGGKLAIVGSGPELPRLEQQAAQLGLDDCVFAKGVADVAPWLRAMDIFVLPSLEEAFSNAIMEAMACRCAVIATNVGGNPELVEAEVRGLLVPPGESAPLAEAIGRLLAASDLRSRLADAGKQFIGRELAREQVAGRLADIYDRVLSKRR